jgi:hypothetical protein
MYKRLTVLATALGLVLLLTGCTTGGYYGNGYYSDGYYGNGYYNDGYHSGGYLGNYNYYRPGYYYYHNEHDYDGHYRRPIRRPTQTPDRERKKDGKWRTKRDRDENNGYKSKSWNRHQSERNSPRRGNRHRGMDG